MSHFASGMIGAVSNLSNLSDGPAPTFVSVSSDGYGESVDMPTGWAAGDLLIIFATVKNLGGTVGGHNLPAGWTELGSWTSGYLGSTFMSRTKAFYRIAQSGDTTVSLTSSGAGTRDISCMMAFRGANTASPFEALATVDMQPASSSIPYAQITTLGINRVVLQAISGWRSGSMPSTPGAGWTELFEHPGGPNLAIDARTFALAGLTSAGNQTRTGSGDWGRMAFAIKPALT